MTYAFTRNTSQGNTLYDRLNAQFGERAARSISLGLEANRKKREAQKQNTANNVGSRPAQSTRPMPNARPAQSTRPMQSARPAQSSRPMPNARPAQNAPQNNGQYSAPRAHRPQSEVRHTTSANNGQYYAPNAQQNGIRRPATNSGQYYTPNAQQSNAQYYNPNAQQNNAQYYTPSANAYNAQYYTPNANAYNARTAGPYMYDVHESDNPYIVRFRKMRKPVTGKSDIEISIATFPRIYRRGEQMRRVTQIAKATPTPGVIKMHFINLKKSLFPTGQHNAELRVRRSPFPVGAVALMIVLTITLMMTISSFANLSEQRANISKLEAEQTLLTRDQNRLTGLIENREDIRVIKTIAINDIGMVSANLAKSKFIPLTDSDRVEVIEDTTVEEEGFFAAILSAIAGNLGSISEYFN